MPATATNKPTGEQSDAEINEASKEAIAEQEEYPGNPAETVSVKPILAVGTRVQITEGEYAGRMAVITDILFDDPAQEARYRNPYGKKRSTARASGYTVQTRDAQTITFSVGVDDLKALSTTEGWGRGQI